MAKKLVFSMFLAVLVLAGLPVQAQQGEKFQYGGSTDPLGTGNDVIGGESMMAKPKRPSSSPVFLSGTGPINLRAGAYVSHEPKPVDGQTYEQPGKPKPNSAIIYNQTLQEKKEEPPLDWGMTPFH